ncbi:sugar phosphate isomerase/epimerase family protein [Roseomonas elaeocarpi]|uniref:Sugar phosphate isomerase/epimerase family protein n=1 Tax=Roseomonas elaeocarpi TaxID=907779 RepID=A0ABV6JTA8_9PROT
MSRTSMRRPVRCFSTLGCAELDLDGTLQLAANHGIPTVEVRALSGSTDLPKIFAERYGTPAGLAAALRDKPSRMVAIGTSLRLIGNTPEDREDFLRIVPWAEAAGVRTLRLFDGGREADAAEFEEALRTLDWWRELRAKNGWIVDINIETHDSLVTLAALERFCRLVADCPLLWDSHHTWRKGGANPLDVWQCLHPHVSHIHVKDSVSQPGPRLPYSYVLPGEGEFPMAALNAVLRRDGYTGLLSLEWERLWHRELPPLDDALRSAEQHGWW